MTDAADPAPILEVLLDGPLDEVWDTSVTSADPLRFPGYAEEVRRATESSGATEAVVTGVGTQGGHPVVVIAGVFTFMGGSMGAATGERVARAFERATDLRIPVLSVVASGGARMQEGMFSLVELPSTLVAALGHREAGLLQAAYLTDPTTGGVYASYVAAADMIVAEPGARIGFAGPRVAGEVLGRPLAEGANTAASALDAGLVDAVAPAPQARARFSALWHACTAEPDPVDPPAPVDSAPEAADAWDDLTAIRDGSRPTASEVAAGVVSDIVTLHGDRAGGVDRAVHAGLGRIRGRPVAFAALDRTAGTGPGRPVAAGYRLVQRAGNLAGRLGIPLVTFVDTPGADPGEASEEAGVAHEISATMALLLSLPVPVLSVVTGQGGSGGALAIAVGDLLLMLRGALFTVITPESAAAILHRDPSRAAEVLPLLAPTGAELASAGIVDGLVEADHDVIAAVLATAIDRADAGGPGLAVRRRQRWRRRGGAGAGGADS